MKKILIFTLAFVAYSNADFFTYSAAHSAKRNAREANEKIVELNVKIDNLAKEINDLKHVIFVQDSLIKAYFVKDTTSKRKNK
jgi:predicted  nucleic acid-binding Zn-ribbon protein